MATIMSCLYVCMHLIKAPMQAAAAEGGAAAKRYTMQDI